MPRTRQCRPPVGATKLTLAHLDGKIAATMSYTVWGAFNDFKERLEPTAKQKEDASTKHTGVREMTSSTPQMASKRSTPNKRR
jgi:hypothetical protein